MELNNNGKGAMTTTKNEVFIVSYHENCYLVGGMNLWWWGSLLGRVFFSDEGISRFSASE